MINGNISPLPAASSFFNQRCEVKIDQEKLGSVRYHTGISLFVRWVFGMVVEAKDTTTQKTYWLNKNSLCKLYRTVHMDQMDQNVFSNDQIIKILGSIKTASKHSIKKEPEPNKQAQGPKPEEKPTQPKAPLNPLPPKDQAQPKPQEQPKPTPEQPKPAPQPKPADKPSDKIQPKAPEQPKPAPVQPKPADVKPVEKIQPKAQKPVKEDPVLSLPKSEDWRLAIESIRPEKPPFDYTTFQLNCNGGDIAFHEGFQHFKTPVINRYDTQGNRNGCLLARIQLTPEMSARLPNLPGNLKDKAIQEGYITIWTELPEPPEFAKANKGPDAIQYHLQYQPHSLLLEEDGSEEDVQLGFFTDAQSGMIEVPHVNDSGVSLNKFCQRTFDCHNNFRTSYMGSFERVEGKPFNAFTAVALRNQLGHMGEVAASYNLMISQNGKKAADAITHSKNLKELIANLEKFPELKTQVDALKTCLLGQELGKPVQEVKKKNHDNTIKKNIDPEVVKNAIQDAEQALKEIEEENKTLKSLNIVRTPAEQATMEVKKKSSQDMLELLDNLKKSYE